MDAALLTYWYQGPTSQNETWNKNNPPFETWVKFQNSIQIIMIGPVPDSTLGSEGGLAGSTLEEPLPKIRHKFP